MTKTTLGCRARLSNPVQRLILWSKDLFFVYLFLFSFFFSFGGQNLGRFGAVNFLSFTSSGILQSGSSCLQVLAALIRNNIQVAVKSTSFRPVWVVSSVCWRLSWQGFRGKPATLAGQLHVTPDLNFGLNFICSFWEGVSG